MPLGKRAVLPFDFGCALTHILATDTQLEIGMCLNCLNFNSSLAMNMHHSVEAHDPA